MRTSRVIAAGSMVLVVSMGCSRARSSRPDPDTSPSASLANDVRTVEVDGLAALAHKPLLVLVERDPWLMVVGSDVPTVTLYEDGLAIYHRGEAESVQALTARAPERVRALVDEIARGIWLLPADIDVSRATDQRTVSLLVRKGTRWKSVEVYGLNRRGNPSAAASGVPPPAFVDAYRKLLALELSGATPWVPDRIELMLWDFSHTKKPVKPWPAEIPKPPADVQLPKSGVYSHFVSASHEPAVRSFLRSLDQTQAIDLNGVPATIGYRRVVPEEQYVHAVRSCVRQRLSGGARATPPKGCR